MNAPRTMLVTAREKMPGVWSCHSRAAGLVVTIAQPTWQAALGFGWDESMTAMVRAACASAYGVRPSAVRVRVLPLVSVEAAK
jgi:hypothetical protein